MRMRSDTNTYLFLLVVLVRSENFSWKANKAAEYHNKEKGLMSLNTKKVKQDLLTNANMYLWVDINTHLFVKLKT